MTQPELQEHVALAAFTAWRIGGPARWFSTATTPEALCEAIAWAQARDVPVFVLGGGSNLLMSDAGWPGLVIRYRAQQQLLHDHGAHARVELSAGVPMAGTARKLAAAGWGGLEWAEGLPGTLGGALYGNAGCYGGDIATVVEAATLLLPDGTQARWQAADFGFAYRTSQLKRWHSGGQPVPAILAATLRLERADPAGLAERMAAIAAQRKAKTPAGSSCGSVFKNPAGTTAGTLLDAAGLKGRQRGGAQVAAKHANYILNTGGATAADVLGLADAMRSEVLRQFGVELELEVRVIGAPNPSASHAEL